MLLLLHLLLLLHPIPRPTPTPTHTTNFTPTNNFTPTPTPTPNPTPSPSPTPNLPRLLSHCAAEGQATSVCKVRVYSSFKTKTLAMFAKKFQPLIFKIQIKHIRSSIRTILVQSVNCPFTSHTKGT